LRALFGKYRSVVRFVLLFLGSYLILSFLYAGYLQLSKGGAYAPDFITHLVAKQSSDMITGFGYKATVIPSTTAPIMELYVNSKYLARIIEGCNAISIIILFMAFIIAFYEKRKKTILFLLAGAVLIYAMNVLRIVILAIALYEFPEQKEILHGVVFPGLIYGMVFLLWMLWVRTLKPRKADG
jgi:exosortase family protein XrtF